MKFVSFNINGLRARPHQLEAIVEQHQPDVIGLQETKVHDDMFPLEEVAKLGYNVFYHGQKGHYGVALLTKETPVSVRRGFPAMTKKHSAASSWRKSLLRWAISR
jgi:exodeoxyribonuclease-3